ncbi:anthranilate phosphoribosyltransferase [Desulfonispora thiosulfatigenes DSM 11270]|uniref:Anthranilate phosphoribosyltransferase n=1 Tax=Desulfonispora thiosulfatigenes DSM 11270 TaxID=656914 RepID=A0A1W1VAQ3_DESTI|nr:anthranilate phosphoribosyltransferase [Desulfonispora thiosulfatigenes]SMB90395.1 anthranilate phosphoribosyltransferase [Desulfonispora thiosulfatigenes DSM 11270]
MKEAISRVVRGENLSIETATSVMKTIMEGNATPAQIGSFLTALRIKGETPEEIIGFARVMREKAISIKSTHPFLIDSVGTGGDGSGTFNISTTVSFVVAGAGLAVAKHGNRSVSSRCGSADVLEALGVKIDLNKEEVERVLNSTGLGFIYAPNFHKAMKHAINPRKEIGIRSIFNLLGPLTNPAQIKYMLLGVYDPNLTEIIAEVLRELGIEGAYVVHGDSGLDEISITGPSKITQLSEGKIINYEITPEQFGFARRSLEEIKGGNAALNARITQKVLRGDKGAFRDIVVLNSAALFCTSKLTKDLSEGVQLAKEIIDSGLAQKKLNELIEVSNKVGGERL